MHFFKILHLLFIFSWQNGTCAVDDFSVDFHVLECLFKDVTLFLNKIVNLLRGELPLGIRIPTITIRD